jgi:hypothetical protein
LGAGSKTVDLTKNPMKTHRRKHKMDYKKPVLSSMTFTASYIILFFVLLPPALKAGGVYMMSGIQIEHAIPALVLASLIALTIPSLVTLSQLEIIPYDPVLGDRAKKQKKKPPDWRMFSLNNYPIGDPETKS